jgi:hypothetical protein
MGVKPMKLVPQSNPFFTTPKQRGLMLLLSFFMVTAWLTLVVLFKQHPNPLGDESGYHDGGVRVAMALGRGSLDEVAFEISQFKYPGYYTIVGTIYWLFGEHSFLSRLLGLVPYFLLAVVLGNLSVLIAGERSRLWACSCALLCPLYLHYSTMMLRDIYVAFAFAIIMHSIVYSIASARGVGGLLNWPMAVGIAILLVMRTPQAFLGMAAAGAALVGYYVLGMTGWKRIVFGLGGFAAAAVAAIVLSGQFAALVDETVFGSGFAADGLQISHFSVLSDRSFSSAQDIFGVLSDVRFVVQSLVLKVTEFFLGFHPFADTGDQADLWQSLFVDFNPGDWGARQWEDVLLTMGLQWLFHFALLPLVVIGIVQIYKSDKAIFAALIILYLTISLPTVFTGNSLRWGLPAMGLLVVLASVGAVRGRALAAQLYGLWAVTLTILIAVRTAGLPVPMIVGPAALILVAALAQSPRHVSSGKFPTNQPGNQRVAR